MEEPDRTGRQVEDVDRVDRVAVVEREQVAPVLLQHLDVIVGRLGLVDDPTALGGPDVLRRGDERHERIHAPLEAARCLGI